jgi:hypothetical protein
MITPYNASRGIDLYVDASGEDDWDLEQEKYYLHGLMLCSPSREWIDWMKVHQTKYAGFVHWSDGKFGKQKQKLENVKAHCRKLLATHPWFRAAIFVIEKKAFKEFFLSRYKRRIKKCEASRALWRTMGVAFLNTIMPHLKKLVPNEPLGCLNVREVVINNPKGGSRQEIEKAIWEAIGRKPKFVAAGHPGIDALDGALWAFQRCLNSGKSDCIPEAVRSFNKDLSVSLLGLIAGELFRLDSLIAIKEFRKRSLHE